MVNLEWASFLTRAFRQLRLLVSAYIIAIALSFVARLAEVRVPPAEPLGNGAAELALELDKVCAVLLANGLAEAERLR